MSTLLLLIHTLLIAYVNSSWVDNYNTTWNEPGVGQWESMPIGNGDLTANVWLQNIDNGTNKYNYDLWFSFSKSDSYDLTGQRLKMIQLKLSFNPPISNSTANTFTQMLYVSNGTMQVKTDTYNIFAWIDINSNSVYIETSIVDNKINSYTLESEIVSWRPEQNFQAQNATGDNFCYNPNPVPIMPDIILQHGCNNNGNSLIFYHRNEWEQGISQYEWMMNEQKLGDLIDELPDPYYNVTFGGLLNLPNSKVSATNTLSATYTSSSIVSFDVLVLQTDTLQQWTQALCSQNDTDKIDMKEMKQLHANWWDSFWNRSSIELYQSDTFLVGLLYNHQRYLDALDGRGMNKSIKFNGQSFYIDVGDGPDYKKWGTLCTYLHNDTHILPYKHTICMSTYTIQAALFGGRI